MLRVKTKSVSLGFTLLELLVVIAIVGILISMGAVAFSTAQRKSRDSKRRSDIKAMQSAFEQYYAQNNGYNTCATMNSTEYLPSGLPVDPKNSGSYVYTCNGAASSYCVCANMEDAGSGNANDPGAATTCTFASGGNYYCLGNLQ